MKEDTMNLDPLREIIERQQDNNFSLEGIPESFIIYYKKKRWLTDYGVATLEGLLQLEKLYNSY
jgi:hypothetical protein